MSKILLDANILIYLVDPAADYDNLRDLIVGKTVCIADITKLEVLGYHQITVAEARALEQLIDSAERVEQGGQVLQKAIELRQGRRMSLGDSLTAASSITADYELWTHNIADYQNISGLKLLDPLA